MGEDNSGCSSFCFLRARVVEQAWRALRNRVVISPHFPVSQLDALVKQYYSSTRLLVTNLALLLKNFSEVEVASERQQAGRRE